MVEDLRWLLSYVRCENNVIICIIIPVDTVESIAADLRFRWKWPEKSVKFICLRIPPEYCRSPGSGGGLLRESSGTLANRPAQTEQSVGHKPWRQG